jgi:ribonuclease-3
VRSALVRRETLAALAEALGIRDHMRIGSHVQFTPAMLADAVEAIFGAVFVDGGYSAARAVVVSVYAERLKELDPQSDLRDAKSRLNERLQAEGKKTPEYRLLQAYGPDNDRTFEVVCAIPELRLEASGKGSSLQRAQQRAAEAMLEKLAT